MKRSGLGTAIQTARVVGGPVIETFRRFFGSLFFGSGNFGP